jgi:hypothetical protein
MPFAEFRPRTGLTPHDSVVRRREAREAVCLLLRPRAFPLNPVAVLPGQHLATVL